MVLMINGKPAKVGMEVTTFRGEKYILQNWREPHTAASSGRVYCTRDGEKFSNEWFPGVINGKFVENVDD